MKLLPFIYDFLSILFENNSLIEQVKAVILFGSVVRGEADEESDIDLFIDVWSGEFIEKVEASVKEAEKRFYTVSERKWSLMGIKQPINCIVGLLDEDKWKELRSEIISSGITLFGKFEALEKDLKHYIMFNYSLSKLDQKEKMKLLRRLFGYRTTTRKKTYIQSGILEEVGGRKLGTNSILVPIEKSREIQKFFNSFKITPEVRDVRIK